MLSDAELAAALTEYRPLLRSAYLNVVGTEAAAECLADAALEFVATHAAEFDPTKDTLFSFAWNGIIHLVRPWVSRAHRTESQISRELAELNPGANLDENEPELRARMRNLILENDTMIAIADRHIDAGHDVWEAGKFAALKAEHAGIRWEPDAAHPVNELMAAIDAERDAAKLTALWDFIFDACYDDSEFDVAA